MIYFFFIFFLILNLSHLCRIDSDCGRIQGYCNPNTKECQCIMGFSGKKCEFRISPNSNYKIQYLIEMLFFNNFDQS